VVGYARGQPMITSGIMREVAEDTIAWDREAPVTPTEPTGRDRPEAR